ncbi:MAG: polysaccharide biosynthesis C-terminal domain-containing protein, partial [Gemmatimonadetes bacterium]|nr:polysaccharide biosynthesis C-terminal domain-containing protein [Gemmatimonadota bacterium]
ATEAHEQGDTATMRSIWTRGTVRLAIMLVPFWVATQIFAPDLFLLLFEARYLPAVPVFRIFVTLFLLLIVVDHGILRATGDTKYLVRASAIGFGAMLLALLLLTRWNVQLGAVMAFIVGAAVMRGVGLIRVAERLEIPVLRCVPWRAIAGSGGLALIAGAAGFVASDWLEGALLRLAVGGVVFSVAYCALVYVFSLVPREEIRGLLARFNPARRPRGSDS